jgi:hypothetical protein
MLTTEQRDAAEDRGTDAGRALASWVFDGNTDRAVYVRFLELDEAGDAYDEFGPRSGWLSGEDADGETWTSLARDILGDDFDEDADQYDADELAQAYEDAADRAYWAELQETAAHMVA